VDVVTKVLRGNFVRWYLLFVITRFVQ